MWQHFAVFYAILAICAANAVTVLTDVCKDLRTGDVAPHPLDCSAYFVCGIVPAIHYCNDGLHFDALRKLCNWPDQAQCELQENNSENSASSTIRINPIFVAIDVETGKATNAMNKYDPKNVQCRHFGAYFLPHPDSCRRYYICAYGHLHKHKCGRGTAWNYKTQECELNDEADCYSRIVSGIDIDAMLDEVELDDNDELSNYPTAPYPTPAQASTVCFVIDTAIVTGATTDYTFHPTGTYHTATTSDPSTTGTYHTATTDSTWHPIGTYHTATTNRNPTATTPRADSGASPATGGLKCPAKGEAYLPNALDCGKYFICIAGVPVPTSCPQGLFWDQSAEFCDLADNVQCFKA